MAEYIASRAVETKKGRLGFMHVHSCLVPAEVGAGSR